MRSGAAEAAAEGRRQGSAKGQGRSAEAIAEAIAAEAIAKMGAASATAADCETDRNPIGPCQFVCFRPASTHRELSFRAGGGARGGDEKPLSPPSFRRSR